MMMPADLLQAAAASRYPLDAYLFLQQGLDFTVRRLHGEAPDEDEDGAADADADEEPSVDRHVTGQQLCEGLRDHAIERFGPMAGSVLRFWGIHRTEHFGELVFTMVEVGLMHKTDRDTPADFEDGFDFREAFAPKNVLRNLRIKH